MPIANGEHVPHDQTLRDLLAANLAAHDVRTQPLAGRRHAAVGVVVIDSDAALHGDDPTELDRKSLIAGVPGVDSSTLTGRVDGTAGGAAVILTRRGSKLNAHANQWALPGGRIDVGETPTEASIREIGEEIGLDMDHADLLGRLDDYPTRSGYVITPFVFWADAEAEPVPNPGEVASIHRISLRELARNDSPRFVTIPESKRPVIQVPIGGDLIHAPTGAIIYQFRAVAYEGRTVRVDEYEQPVFAWK
ncbi:MAG: CoA pyrophosphatase [Acidimicrobiia bacterium]|nr:CoA pyrophosphatase [Acidimicrobiia bacterium]